MDLALTDTQKMVQDTARRVAKDVLAPRAKDLDRNHGFPDEQVKALGEVGLLGVNLPEDLGGSAAGVVSYSLAMTEVAAACAATSVTMAVTNMCGEVIARFGTEAQKQQWIPKLTSAEIPGGAFGLSEPQAGSDAGHLRTRAEKKGDRWILNGEKMWITTGDRAGVYVVWARTGGEGPGGISTFLVPGGTKGLTPGKPESKMGQRGSPTVGIAFEDCEIPEDALLGKLGEGFKVAMMALDGGRIGIASQAYGIGRAALEAATAYAKEREAFGHPIAEFQAIQWKLADMATELEAAAQLVARAAWLRDAGKPHHKEAAMAKLFASESAARTCDQAARVLASYGYAMEYPVQRYLRDVRFTLIGGGTSEILKLVIAKELSA